MRKQVQVAKRRAAASREIISRSGMVTGWSLEFHAWAIEDPALGKRSRSDSCYLEFTGSFNEAIGTTKDFVVMISAADEVGAGAAEIPCVGVVTRAKPQFQAVITVSTKDFQALATFAAAEKICSVDLTFQKLRYGSGLISSALFATNKASDLS
ncbi:hypothetical protein QTI51_37470 [Variovorax sp. J22G73]|uniref:hypothetical protein n=1 Tax=unclassified Variovorax TaxID=663243 RepID=UPI002574AE76|nr:MULTISPECIES: hypothetical protein [unclassified Variovorax]MDM0010125.1 hypothetical protein [Variovorax sp. J22R203]MDM0103016.1 hypothetical protein [Variovorax sp. J22G73]